VERIEQRNKHLAQKALDDDRMFLEAKTMWLDNFSQLNSQLSDLKQSSNRQDQYFTSFLTSVFKDINNPVYDGNPDLKLKFPYKKITKKNNTTSSIALMYRDNLIFRINYPSGDKKSAENVFKKILASSPTMQAMNYFASMASNKHFQINLTQENFKKYSSEDMSAIFEKNVNHKKQIED
jgi:hypothetical protein